MKNFEPERSPPPKSPRCIGRCIGCIRWNPPQNEIAQELDLNQGTFKNPDSRKRKLRFLNGFLEWIVSL